MTFGLNILQYNKTEKDNNVFRKQKSLPMNKFIQNVSTFTNFNKVEYDQYFVSDCLFGEKTICNINTINGDLINEIYLLLTLPSISLNNDNMEFRWINNIGFRIIDFIEIMIDDISLQKIPGKYIELYHNIMKNNIDMDKMIGNNIPEINDYSRTKNQYTLYIPIPFYFCIDNNNALPISRLQNKNIRIYVSFNNIENLIEYGPDSLFTISETDISSLKKYDTIYQDNRKVGTFFYYDETKQLIHYKKYLSENIHVNDRSLQDNITSHIMKKNTSTLLHNASKTWLNIPVKTNEINTYYIYDFSNIINFQSHLVVKYVTLSEEERHMITKTNSYNKVEYMITDIDINIYDSLNDTKDIFEVNSNKKLVDIFFFTESTFDGILTDYIFESSLYMNDNVIVYEKKDSAFTNSLTWFESYMQQNKIYMEQKNKYIHMYNFCLNPENILKQPSGFVSMNFFHKLQLHIKYKQTNEKNTMYIITRSYKNILL